MASESTTTLPTSDTDLPTVDVLIIGYGPVGKMAALQLARQGHSVLAAERKKTPYPLPRAVAHDAEIARIFQNVGLPPDSMPDAVEPYDDFYVWVNGRDQILHQVDWTGIDPSGWNNTYFYNQPALEEHLDRAVRATSHVDVRRGVSATIDSQDDKGVIVTLTDVDEGVTTRVRAQYVLAADGANSATRRQVGVDWNDLGYFFDWLVVDVVPRPGVSLDDLGVTHLAKQVADPVRPTTVVPGGPGRRRWEFMRLEGESTEELVDPERIWALLAPYGVTPEAATVERGVVYKFASGWAKQWQQGRVFLLGDAAHQMPPFAGQGLAAGLRDCVNLAWKLDLVLRGVSGPGILSSYDRERSAHVADFIDFSMSLGRIICITDPAEAAARDGAMISSREAGAESEPPPTPRLGEGVHTGDHGGILSRQGQITTHDTSRLTRFDDIFGPGALILKDASAVERLTPEAIESLRLAGIRIATFDTKTDSAAERFTDARGTYEEWFKGAGVVAVLIRPDFYIYGDAANPDAIPGLVDAFLSDVALDTNFSPLRVL